MSEGAIRIEGLAQLNAHFKVLSDELRLELRETLIKAAEPVRETAERLAVQQIANMDSHWSRMRIGVTGAVTAVYVVPASRRRRGSRRPNLADLLMDRSMSPALDQNVPEVEAALGSGLDRLCGAF